MSDLAREAILNVDSNGLPKKKLKLREEKKPVQISPVEVEYNEPVMEPKKPDNVVKSYMIESLCGAQIIWDEASGRHRYELVEPAMSPEEKKLFDDIIRELHKKPRTELALMKKIGARERIRQKFESNCNERHITGQLKEKILYYIERDFWGYKKIDGLLKDRNVEDISCNGYDRPVYVYIPEFESIPTNIFFNSEEELDDFAMYLVQRGGKSISAANPIQDVALPDGSRLNGTIYREVSSNGTTFSIRLASRAKGASELLRRNTFSPESMAFLWLAMENKCSMAFIGGTASGKTAALNAICSFITDKNKIVTIEDTREVRMASQNWTPLVVRETGESPISEFDLLVAAFRQRPEYVIIGEVRTPEGARAAIHGINSGHTVMMTFHADTSQNFFNRIMNEPFNISPFTASSLSICVNLSMVTVPSGASEIKVRRCKSICEVCGVKEDGNMDITPLFEWDAVSDRLVMPDRRSKILEKIKDDRGWGDERLIEELTSRAAVLRWIGENSIVSDDKIRELVEKFRKDRIALLSMIKESGKSIAGSA
jgi:flagellar protein FlaI